MVERPPASTPSSRRRSPRSSLGASIPTRVIFDTKLRIPASGRLVATARETPTWVITSLDSSPAVEQTLSDQGVEVLRVAPSAEGRIDVTAALRALAQRGVVSLMV